LLVIFHPQLALLGVKVKCDFVWILFFFVFREVFFVYGVTGQLQFAHGD
jgi:hypothetical protein